MAERGKDEMDASVHLHALFKAAVAAADPALRVPDHLPPPPEGRVIVVGAGKASGYSRGNARPVPFLRLHHG